jgi:hypothetical protein
MELRHDVISAVHIMSAVHLAVDAATACFSR